MKFLIIYFVFFLLTTPQPVVSETKLYLHGMIDKNLVNDLQTQISQFPKETNWVLHFDTPGGSVMDGMRLLPFLEKNNVTCVVSRAYSMGFILLQACTTRSIEKYGTLMMHDMQLSFGSKTEFSKIKSYVEFLQRIYDQLLLLQIQRIGISADAFKTKIQSDWWMDAYTALIYNCVDEIK